MAEPGNAAPPKPNRKYGVRRRLVVIAAWIGAVFAVPVAIKTGLDGLGLSKPLEAAVVGLFVKSRTTAPQQTPVLKREDTAEREFIVYFGYGQSTLANEGTVIPGFAAVDARDPLRRFSIGCVFDGAEESDRSLNAVELGVARARNVRNELIDDGVPPQQILPGWDSVPPTTSPPGVREPLNRRCNIVSSVPQTPN
jgi:hypothetical protein